MSKWMSMDDLKKKEEESGKQQEFYSGGNSNRGGSGMATLGPPSDNPFDKIVRKAQDEQNVKDDGGSADELKLTLYRNGFTVDDGPFRDKESPENVTFVEDLMKGFIPAEVMRERREKGLSDRLNVNILDKRSEDYREPTPPPYVAFGGEGSSLGTVESGGVMIDPSSADMQRDAPTVDTSQPTTLLQVKLADGKKIRVKLNKHHTVMDLVAMIYHRDGDAGSNDAPYYLCAGFPPKDVTDINITLEAAGLVGAAIVQKSV